LFVGFEIDLLEKHYVSGLISADDLRFVPVQLQTGRAGDEPVVLNCFHREVAHFRRIILRAVFDRAIAEEKVNWLRAGWRFFSRLGAVGHHDHKMPGAKRPGFVFRLEGHGIAILVLGTSRCKREGSPHEACGSRLSK